MHFPAVWVIVEPKHHLKYVSIGKCFPIDKVKGLEMNPISITEAHTLCALEMYID